MHNQAPNSGAVSTIATSKEHAPYVSVVIPVYNRAARVRQAIESVLAQTYPFFEIIVVDDGSTDSTAASIAAIRDRRVRIITHIRNRGGSAARNSGIRASTAPYVAFLDSDDQWLPRKLEQQVKMFAQSDDSLGLVYTGAERIYSDGSKRTSIPERRRDLARALLTANVIGETSVGMVRRSTLVAIGGFDETLPSSQDHDLWLRIGERYLIDCVPEPLVRASKGNDHGRISKNVAGVIRGRQLFCEKHRDKMRAHGVLYRYLRFSGWVYQRAACDPIRARQLYMESLLLNPLAPLTYVLLLVTYFPTPLLDRLAQWKQQVTAFVQHRYRGSVRGRSGHPSGAMPVSGQSTQ